MLRKIIKLISLLLCFVLFYEQTGFAQVAGQLDISSQVSAGLSNIIQDKFRPIHLRYLSFNPTENNFKLLLDKGSLKNPDQQLIDETTKELLKYFLIGVTLPNDSFWVNLRPDATNEVMDELLAKTDVGKILIEADLQLKRDTAKYTSPQTQEGKEYWNKLYQKAEELYGTQQITIPTLNRPWIVPDEIIVRENQGSAYIYKATMKVMLEDDYLKGSQTYNFTDDKAKALNEYSSQLLKETIIPKITKEINSAKRYASLRQVYYSLILAQWFKSKYSVGHSRVSGNPDSVNSKINSKDLTGLTSKESWSRDTYYQAYQKSFKDGEYNIKEPKFTANGHVIRSYVSGGVVFTAEMLKLIEAGLMHSNADLGEDFYLKYYEVIAIFNKKDGIQIKKNKEIDNNFQKEIFNTKKFISFIKSEVQNLDNFEQIVKKDGLEKFFKEWFADREDIVLLNLFGDSELSAGFVTEPKKGIIYRFNDQEELLVIAEKNGKLEWILEDETKITKMLDSIIECNSFYLDQAAKETAEAVIKVAKAIKDKGFNTVVMSGASNLLAYKLLSAAWKKVSDSPLTIYTLSSKENYDLYQADKLEISKKVFENIVKMTGSRSIMYVDTHWNYGVKRFFIEDIANRLAISGKMKKIDIQFSAFTASFNHWSDLIGTEDKKVFTFISDLAQEISDSIKSNPDLVEQRLSEKNIGQFEKEVSVKTVKYLDTIVLAIDKSVANPDGGDEKVEKFISFIGNGLKNNYFKGVATKILEQHLKNWFRDEEGLALIEFLKESDAKSFFEQTPDKKIFYKFSDGQQVLVLDEVDGQMQWVLNDKDKVLKLINSIREFNTVKVSEAIDQTADIAIDLAKKIQAKGYDTVLMSGGSTIITYKLLQAAWEKISDVPLKIITLSAQENIDLYNYIKLQKSEVEFNYILKVIKSDRVMYVDTHWNSGTKRHWMEELSKKFLKFDYAVFTAPRNFNDDIIGTTDNNFFKFFINTTKDISSEVTLYEDFLNQKVNKDNIEEFESILSSQNREYLNMVVKAIVKKEVEPINEKKLKDLLNNAKENIVDRKILHIDLVIEAMNAFVKGEFNVLYDMFSEKLKVNIDKNEYISKLEELKKVYDALPQRYKEILKVVVIFHDVGALKNTKAWDHYKIGSEKVKNILKGLYDENFINEVSKIIYLHSSYYNLGVDLFPEDFVNLNEQEKDILMFMSLFDSMRSPARGNILSTSKIELLKQLRYEAVDVDDFYHFRLSKFFLPLIFIKQQEQLSYADVDNELAKLGQVNENFIYNWNKLVRIHVFNLFYNLSKKSISSYFKLVVQINNMIEKEKKDGKVFNEVIVDTDIDFMELDYQEEQPAYINKINTLLEANKDVPVEVELKDGTLYLKFNLKEDGGKKKLAVITPRPLLDNSIDKKAARQWVYAHKEGVYRQAAQIIVDNINRVPFPKFERSLAETITDFKSKNKKLSYVVLNDSLSYLNDKYKSNPWVINLAIENGLNVPKIVGLQEIDPNENQDVVIIDDAAYSGDQIQFTITALKKIGVKRVHILVPYMSSMAQETMQAALLKTSDPEDIKTEVIFYSHKLIETINDIFDRLEKENSLGVSQFQYRALREAAHKIIGQFPVWLTYFAHTLPDNVSFPKSIAEGEVYLDRSKNIRFIPETLQPYKQYYDVWLKQQNAKKDLADEFVPVDSDGIEGGNFDGTAYVKYKDKNGKVWFLKEYPDYRKHRMFIDEIFSKLVMKLSWKNSKFDQQFWPAGFVGKINGTEGSFVEWMENKGSLWDESSEFGIDYPKYLSEEVLKRIVREQVLDWLFSNHDSHPGNFLKSYDLKNPLYPIDKAQAFKHFGDKDEKLNVNYNPNGDINGFETVDYMPIYNVVLPAIAQGKCAITLADAYNEVEQMVRALEEVSTEEFLDILRDYAVLRFDQMKDKTENIFSSKEFLCLAAMRKQSIKNDFFNFYMDLGLANENVESIQSIAKYSKVGEIVNYSLNKLGYQIKRHKVYEQAFLDTINSDNLLRNLPIKDLGKHLDKFEGYIEKDNDGGSFGKKGGIDFRTLPIVTQAISNLRVNALKISLNQIQSIDVDKKLKEMQNMLSVGISPSVERVKEYVQASCLKEDSTKYMKMAVSCIADIMRLEEDKYCPTNRVLKDILLVLESDIPTQELKSVFTGVNS